MPSGDICVANIGTPVPLSYGYFRATGMPLIDFAVPSTASLLPNMQIGFWDLGEGELDGCDALWINNELQFAFDPTGNLMGPSLLGVTPSDAATTGMLNQFGFHTGCDAPTGGFPGYSVDSQWLDPLWNYLGSLVTPLCYSRRAYYSIGWTPPTDANASISPIGDFRGMRCRIFDGDGNQTAYEFTTNPIWHTVDLWLRRAIKPEYAIDPSLGPDALTDEESSCFNWASIYASAQYCDEILANGSPRFMGSYVFASGSTLASMHEQTLLSCRGYQFEYAGQIYIMVDQPKSSTFVVSAKHLAPGSIQRDDTQVNQNANRYIAQFLELGLPAVATISTIVRTSSNVQIETVNPNPCAPGDIISVGGVANPSFDACYDVTTTPTETEVDSTISGGVAASSTGGSIGYIQSRFSQRTPEISHLQHQLAQGQILPPAVTGTRLKRIKVTYNFGSTTYDQANRLLKYEIYRDLGIDFLNPNLLQQVFGNLDMLGAPYIPPFGLTLSLWSEATDTGGTDGALRALKSCLQGDVITVDSSVLYEFAGEYEIMERYISPIQQEIDDSTDGDFVDPTNRTGQMTTGTDSGSGVLKLVLRTYNGSSAIFTDVSDAPNSSFATVPGYLPYAGDSSGGPGYTATGYFTVSTPYSEGSIYEEDDTTVTFEDLSITLPTGITLNYGGGTLGPLAQPPTTYYIYVNDPSNSGLPACVGVGTSPYPSGPGVYNLRSISLPPAPSLPGSPNVYSYSL